MDKIYSGYDKQPNIKLFYSIIIEEGKENGFDIYEGDSLFPIFHQPEPWILDRSKTYAENAIQMCKEISENSKLIPEPPFVITKSMYTDLTASNETMRADLDYLLLLSE